MLKKKKAEINKMMPGTLVLEDGAAGGSDGGAMSRQKSNKKKAVLAVLEQPSEGQPPSGGSRG